MADYIEQIRIIGSNSQGTTYNLMPTAYFSCETGSSTADKVLTIPNFNFSISGCTIQVQFLYQHETNTPYLLINSDVAHKYPIYSYGDVPAKWPAGAVLTLTLAGTSWIQSYDNSFIGPSNEQHLLWTNNGIIANGPLIGLTITTPSSSDTFLRNDGTWAAPLFPVTSVASLTGEISTADLYTALFGNSDIGAPNIPIYLSSSTGFTAGEQVMIYKDDLSTYGDIDMYQAVSGFITVSGNQGTYAPKEGSYTFLNVGSSTTTTQNNISQIFNLTGTSEWFVRSNSIKFTNNKTAWDSTWKRLVTTHATNAIGSSAIPIYVDSNGEVQTCSLTTIDNANTLTTAREIYVSLSTERDENNPIVFDGSNDIAIAVDGVLPTDNGGTGTSIAPTVYGVIYGAINNNVPYYDSTDAPDEDYSILISGIAGNNATPPEWAAAATLSSKIKTSTSNTVLTLLTLGNSTPTTTNGGSEGQIKIYSSNIEGHLLKVKSTTTAQLHEFVNNTDSTHVNGGIIMELDGVISTDTNRIPYSANAESLFVLSNHYINSTQMAINYDNNTTLDSFNFVVNGTTKLDGITSITNTTDSSNNGGALIVTGGIKAKNIYLTHNASIIGTLTVSSTTELTGHVGIGTSPDNDFVLFVNGETFFNDDVNIGDDSTSYNLYVSGTSYLNGNVGIGDEADEDYSLYVHGYTYFDNNIGIGIVPNTDENDIDIHVLTICGSTFFTNSVDDTLGVHLDMISTTTNNNTITTLEFYPETTHTGIIGSDTNKWNEGYFSHLLKIQDSVSIITLETVDNTNDGTHTGIITITAAAPTIMLDTTSNNSDWTIINDAGNFKIYNSNIINYTELSAQDSGIKINNRLYINQSLPLINNDVIASGAVNFYVYGTSKLDGNTGIGIAPNNTIRLLVSGTSQFEGNVGINTDVNNHALSINDNIGIYITISNASTLAGLLQARLDNMTVMVESEVEGEIVTEPNTITIPTLDFTPAVTNYGEIGKNLYRWNSGYFSDLLQVGRLNDNNAFVKGIELNGIDSIVTIKNSASTISLDTASNGNLNQSQINITSNLNPNSTDLDDAIQLYTATNTGIISVIARSPTIKLHTTSRASIPNTEPTEYKIYDEWTITNDEGYFLINNDFSPSPNVNNNSRTPVYIKGDDNGFEIKTRVFINEEMASNSTYTLVVGGDTESGGSIIPSANNNSNYTLGNSNYRWNKLYIGNNTTHGDNYTPIYWNDGSPTAATVVTKQTFEITANNSNTTITFTNTHKGYMRVVSLVVTSGFSYFTAPLTWENNNGTITISASSAVPGKVAGYILVASSV